MPIEPVSGKIEAQKINDNFSYIDSKTNNISKGSPAGTYATVAALKAAYPNGNSNIYVVTADGNWYFWNGSDWTAGGKYQETGIGDKSIDVLKLTNDVNMVNYPFVTLADVPNEAKAAIVNIKMYNVDPSKKYALSVLRKKYSASNIFSLIIYEAINDNVLGDAIASFTQQNYAPSSLVERIYLTSLTSDALIEVLINWDALPDGTNFAGLRYNRMGIHQSCIEKPTVDNFSAYPFVFDPRYRLPVKNNAILDAQLIGADPSKCYVIGSLYKNYQGTTRIIIHEWDKENNQWAGGSSTTSGRASWTAQDYVPSAQIEWIDIPQFNPSAGGYTGFPVRLLIDWSKIPDGSRLSFSSYGSATNNFDPFHPNAVVTDKEMLQIKPNRFVIDGISGVNYVGAWFNREMNGKQVTTTNLYCQGAYLGFYGTSLNMEVIRDTYDAGINYRVDGGVWQEIMITESGNLALATGLENKEHFVEIYSRVAFGYTLDESPYFSNKGNLNIVGFDEEVYPLKSKGLNLLFIGDSITAGQGDSFAAGYAARTAELLNSNAIRIAQPGGALTVNDSRPYLPNGQQFAFNLADGNRSFPYPADAIVFNIGHNDSSSTTDAVFTQKLVEVIKNHQFRNPGAPVILLRPFSGKREAAVKNAANQTSSKYIDTTGWNFTTVDGTHPDTAGAIALSEKLAPALIKTLGKDFFR